MGPDDASSGPAAGRRRCGFRAAHSSSFSAWTADPPAPDTFNVQSGYTEPVSDSAPVAESTLPEESTHVPFLQSLMAAVDPGAAHFGGPGFGAFGGGGFLGGGFGGGTGGAAQAQSDSTLQSQFGDTGSERASLLGDHAARRLLDRRRHHRCRFEQRRFEQRRFEQRRFEQRRTRTTAARTTAARTTAARTTAARTTAARTTAARTAAARNGDGGSNGGGSNSGGSNETIRVLADGDGGGSPDETASWRQLRPAADRRASAASSPPSTCRSPA